MFIVHKSSQRSLNTDFDVQNARFVKSNEAFLPKKIIHIEMIRKIINKCKLGINYYD